jgi:hypothetical protein
MVYEVLDRRGAADRWAFHRVSANLLDPPQPYWSSRDYRLKARGYYGTPYGGGPQYGSGGGDQYGYGPAYSYAKQAPSRYPRYWARRSAWPDDVSPRPSRTRRSRTFVSPSLFLADARV